MSEERIQNITSPQPEEQEIDLIELAQKVWASRKLVFKACGIAALVGLVVAFSIPKEYSTSVTLAPESGGKSGGGDDCSHLEKGVSQCLSQSCIERADIPGNRQSTGENDQKIPTNFFEGKSFLKLLS